MRPSAEGSMPGANRWRLTNGLSIAGAAARAVALSGGDVEIIGAALDDSGGELAVVNKATVKSALA